MITVQSFPCFSQSQRSCSNCEERGEAAALEGAFINTFHDAVNPGDTWISADVATLYGHQTRKVKENKKHVIIMFL